MDTDAIVSALTDLESSNHSGLNNVESKLADVVRLLKRIERLLEEIKKNQ